MRLFLLVFVLLTAWTSALANTCDITYDDYVKGADRFYNIHMGETEIASGYYMTGLIPALIELKETGVCEFNFSRECFFTDFAGYTNIGFKENDQKTDLGGLYLSPTYAIRDLTSFVQIGLCSHVTAL